MGIFGKIKLVFIIVALLTGGTLAYLGKDITKTSLDGYDITGIRSLDSTGFNVDIVIRVTNPSKLTLKADTIRYTAVLRDSGQTVAQGFIEGLTLTKEETTEIEISPRINWVPTADLVAKYASEEHVWVDVNFDVTLYSILPAVSFSVPVDIKEVFGDGNFLNNGVIDDSLFKRVELPNNTSSNEAQDSADGNQSTENNTGPLFELTF